MFRVKIIENYVFCEKYRFLRYLVYKKNIYFFHYELIDFNSMQISIRW